MLLNIIICTTNKLFINFKLLPIIFFYMIFLLLAAFTNGEQIQDHLVECCALGTTRAQDCQNTDNVMNNIPPVWRGLCLSTFSMCCSKEFQNQQCLDGRYAAKNGGNCDVVNKLDITTSYTNCCKACQIGLAVAAGDYNCTSSRFAYFQKEESFLICCNEMTNENLQKQQQQQQQHHQHQQQQQNQHQINHQHNINGDSIDNDDGTFVLSESEDICTKFNKQLCSHICENTKESYVCKCHKGYKLDNNRVTCSKINDDDNDDDNIDNNHNRNNHNNNNNNSNVYNSDDNVDDIDDDADDDDDDDLDNIEENPDTNFENDNSCPTGYSRSEITGDCEDIDECNSRFNIKCNSNQYCFNTIGSYKCMDIKPTTCQDGYRFNAKTEECEDYDECEDNLCEQGYICINLPGSYDCQRAITSSHISSLNDGSNIRQKSISGTCGFGYIYKHNKCIDIDECLTDKNACDTNQICTNENGGYRCDCKIGFKMDSTLNACVDINECQINNHNCLPTQRCDNTIGSYTCIRLQNCGTGYTLNAETGTCDDDNECELNSHDCPPGYECRNTIGSFRCDRKRHTTSRYTLYQRRLTTVRPTTISQQSTTTSSILSSTLSSSHENIPTTLTTTTTTSPPNRFIRPYYVPVKPPPSDFATADTNLTTTTTTSTTTTTMPSTIPSASQKQLYSDNQIQHNSYYTPSLRSPTQSANSYYNQLPHRYHVEPEDKQSQQNQQLYQQNYQSTQYTEHQCNRGFQKNYKGACVDIDECQIHGSCASHQRCINTNGSYRCQNLLQCSGGYKASMDGTSCVDIDECVTGEHNCGPDQICRNRIGGYICSCPIGHTLNNDNRCIDINECEHQVCPMNSNCINTIGSYVCDCKEGFKKLNDRDNICHDIDECQDIQGLCEQKCINFWGSYRCACNPGYELNIYNNRSCDDIDECEVHKKYQLCTGICNNVQGSYECSCPDGYELGTDKNSCRDIDECQTLNICQDRNEICTNTRGGYKCTYINCPDGYTNDIDQKNRCRLINNLCEGDECYNKPTSYTYNFITLVSNMMIPPQGRTFFSLRGPAWYENIDFELKLVDVQSPFDVEKATMKHFSTTQMRNQVQLNLLRSLEGPQEIELELSMTVFMNGQPRGKSIAKVFIIVSQYTF
ncbi:fibulin-1 [Condylostylus longicornis]|uniref:fibulin-1 n=1 Tax=Condylostylus longicornis TaxID=2530218 RepID=UPI00244E027E|nr:fibulin-1 [Condylostylus longicornis]